MHNNYINF